MYKAHVSESRIQSCNDHSRNTALYTSKTLECINLKKLGYLCGILHDVGKYTEEFQMYIEAASMNEKVKRGSVIHSFAGVRLVLERYHSEYSSTHNSGWENITAELIATAVGSHHGLFDEYNSDCQSGLRHRMEKQPDFDRKAIDNFVCECISFSELDRLFEEAKDEVNAIAQSIHGVFNDYENFMFCIGALQRLITSALIDSDRRDTAEFMLGKVIYGSEHDLNENKAVWEYALKNVEELIDSFPQNTEIEKARREMSDLCADFAERSGAIYQLDLPTGAGKTLSSLRYALRHASLHDKKRVIFAVPLLSVLDQNAEAIRKAVKNDELILEHHSNIVQEKDFSEQTDYTDYLIETWDSPIIITTLVQLLNTCLKGKTSCVRRFHALCDAVIVIDEVQSVPERMISIFNMMMNFISKICGATIVLCSATQPVFEQVEEHPLLVSDKAIVPELNLQRYKRIFKRNTVRFEGTYTVEEIMSLVSNYLIKYTSVLIVCNTKAEASDLYKKMHGSHNNCFHLSTSMCMAHRKSTLNKVQNALKKSTPLICISTQLIEAGVDLSFGSVIRYSAGIDNIVQAAGRCNRHAEKSIDSPVSVVSINGENLQHLKDIKRAQDATRELLAEFQKVPSKFDDDLISDSSISYYYHRLYSQLNKIRGFTEYSVNGHTLFDLLSTNEQFSEDEDAFTMRQAFKTAGEEFEVFSTDQISILVPYSEGEEIIKKILSEKARADCAYLKKLLVKAKEYCVNVFSYQCEKLTKEDALYFDDYANLYILDDAYYNNALGVITSRESEENEWNTLIL